MAGFLAALTVPVLMAFVVSLFFMED